MRISSRTKSMAFFITLGVFLVALTVVVNVGWIVINWRRVAPLIFGLIFFGLIIAGLSVNTVFLVREIRRNEQQDSFLNAVTHELKTPIASIRMYLETLQSRQLDEPQRRDFYRIMLEDTDRLLGTVEQVLKAGEARQRSKRKNWEELDFSELVKSALELTRLRHHLTPENLRFGTAPPEGLLVQGSPEELRTVVFNLFDNAVKYSGESKEIVVDVGTPDMDTVLLSVRDLGIGIPRSELKRIFNRFYRATNPLAGQVKGTGLGLFIVRSIARRHGGNVYAESEGEGRGSTFTVRLPRIYRV
ncbi:MAG TPA: HAMP domain-containing sensor histidine kinase [Candidatus Sulfotelmatobacter sp.]|jgi:two-component system sensor histidine kinase SenX3|nr:HAMP domain-containing sensor histidine kinase [Candidatus Sulfotelmatobacter sp.]